MSTIKLVYAGVGVAALLSTAPANATVEVKPDPHLVTISHGAGSQVRTSGTQGDVRVSGTQGLIRNTVKAVPGVRANAMPTPNTCSGVMHYTCDD